jgi:hypothetical protein
VARRVCVGENLVEQDMTPFLPENRVCVGENCVEQGMTPFLPREPP